LASLLRLQSFALSSLCWLLGNVDTAEAAMVRLKALGVRLALDDFSTGYSSLLYLRRFPFDKLKIDRSFVRSIERAADAAAIVHAIVSLSRGLGMQVTSEGVETGDQQLSLRAAGAHSMQGYRFGRPARSPKSAHGSSRPAPSCPPKHQHLSQAKKRSIIVATR
jgi:EAL domain-containing protein (putative c-di-GMP-specific phosphodiesterase class I)